VNGDHLYLHGFHQDENKVYGGLEKKRLHTILFIFKR